ncbi:hypothetical protein NQX30_01135 [Candidatus Persebacteraceae bacterium Df01]|jgi:hypothetical protein|uniref:Lipoprotein n=1 Tax=Candidatus Doriopsillibacter californiensis TaxID=2970740 RepID=A0ABT7QJZ3_9GAMM|nr:hypothetical protein [Candidatus Persebacteraceae bacterium Df01]
MKQGSKRLLGVGLVGVVVAISGCSSVLRGTHEKVEIVTTPEKALCKLYRGSEGYLKSVATPGAVYIPRSVDSLEVVCYKDGYEVSSVVVEATKSNDIFGNVATGGLGIFVDLVSSSHLHLPDTINVNMEKMKN